MDKIFERLEGLVDRFNELQELMADPEIINDTKRYMEITKEEAGLREIVETYNAYKANLEELSDLKEMLYASDDDEMTAEIKKDMSDDEQKTADLETKLKVLLLPEDELDDKNIIMEIRPAAGGDESSLFVGDLLEMYEKYAERQGWDLDIIDSTTTEVGGFKEVSAIISGKNVYSKLKYENGAHRVQRIPKTESQGRVHTSTATVAVMPEYDEVEIDINPKDIRTDVYRSSGAGGQHINKTSSAVRMTHIPTGIVVAMQDERSQQQNREKAMKILKSRIYDFYESQNQSDYDENRKNAVGTGDRSERIRTYNYPQNRVTDHRINLTLNKLDKIMAGEIGDVIDALVVANQTKQLEALEQD